MRLLRPAVAEFIGIFFLVFIGIGAIVTNTYRDGSVGLLGIAAAHGVALFVAVTATMHISGGHLNPAVTIGLWSVGRINVRMALAYIVAQLLGAITAAFAVQFLYPEAAGIASQLGTPRLANDVTPVQGILIEAILSFLLAFAVMGTAVDNRAAKLGGLAIGLTVFFDILAGGQLTGAAMNPGRAFGPALVSGTWTAQAIYWIGPILGVVAGMQVYERLLMNRDPVPSV
jgi:MIP family channel proteins